MNLDQLEAVLAVAQTGGFRSAAETLRRSPSSLSEQIKALEEEFNLQIFDRATYRAKLTEAGQAFVKSAQSTLAAAQLTSRIATELGVHQAETRLDVAVDNLASPEYLHLLASLCAKPHVPVNLVIARTLGSASVDLLVSGRIQLSVAPAPNDTSQIEKIPLETVRLVGVIHKSLVGDQPVTIEKLSRLTQIVTYATHVDEGMFDVTPAAYHRAGSHKIFVPEHAVKAGLIKSAVGWGRLSERDLADGKDLLVIDSEVVEQVPLHMCLMRAKLKPIGQTARDIWSAFAAQYAPR